MADPESDLAELSRIQQELIEYQNEAKEYELSLEQSLVAKEARLSESLDAYKSLQETLETLKKKSLANTAELDRLNSEIGSLNQKLKRFEDQKNSLEMLNDQWEKSAKILEFSKQTLEEKLYQAEEAAILYKEELEELDQTRMIKVQRLKEEYQELKQELVHIEGSSDQFDKKKARSPTPTLRHTVETVLTIPTPSRPFSKTNSRSVSRKQSMDELSARQSVKVLVVFRPSLATETWDPDLLQFSESTVTVKEKNKEAKNFDFEKVYAPGADSSLIFGQIVDSIEKLSAGGSSCVMAYGQTGSGKTYTMNAMISLALLKLSEINPTAQLSLQCIEVYNEQLKDLLSEEPLSKNWKEVLSRSEVKLGTDWYSQVWELVQKAISRRVTKFTECNERSSRSHAIICLNVAGSAAVGKVQFVDLAGSERIGKSQVAGETLKEALLINKSLSALQDVISALENKQKHIPYRNSMLTQILKPTLGGSDSMVTMIMNCSPVPDSLNETLSTLSLAARVKAVDLGFFIRKNLVTKEVERTLSLLEKERSEKNSLLRILDKLQRDLEAFQISLKDKDNKISTLNMRLKSKESSKQLEKAFHTKKNKSRMNDNDLRVSSLSPTLPFHISPSNFKDSKIPTLVNLKFGRK